MLPYSKVSEFSDWQLDMQYKWIYLSLICHLFGKSFNMKKCTFSEWYLEGKHVGNGMTKWKKLGQNGDWMKIFTNLVFKNSPKNHSASSYHWWEKTLLTFRISLWTRSWAGICYVAYSEVKYMKSIKEGYLIIVCLGMSTEQPTSTHCHNQK